MDELKTKRRLLTCPRCLLVFGTDIPDMDSLRTELSAKGRKIEEMYKQSLEQSRDDSLETVEVIGGLRAEVARLRKEKLTDARKHLDTCRMAIEEETAALRAKLEVSELAIRGVGNALVNNGCDCPEDEDEYDVCLACTISGVLAFDQTTEGGRDE